MLTPEDIQRTVQAAMANETPENKSTKEFLISGIRERILAMRDGITGELPDRILFIRDFHIFNDEYGDINVRELLNLPKKELDAAKEKAFKEILEDLETWYENIPFKGVNHISNRFDRYGSF